MLTKFSLKKPVTILVAVAMILVLSIVSFTNMQTDLLPSMDMPYVIVVTSYPGATPEKIETEVTKPLESALATVGGVEKVQSQSSENMSMVILQFAYSTNMNTAMINLNNKVNSTAAQLDDGVSTPVLMQINPDMIPVMVASVSKEGADLQELTRLTNETVVPALERADGVASVSAMGTLAHTVQVTLNDDKINAINEKIVAFSDEKTADALKKLNDGKKALEQAQNELDNKKNTAAAQLAEAGIAIADGKTAIQMGISAIDSAVTQAKSMKAILEPILKQLDQIQNTSPLDSVSTELAALLTSAGKNYGNSAETLQKLSDSLEKLTVSDIPWDQLEELVKDNESALEGLKALEENMAGMIGPEGSLTTQLEALAKQNGEQAALMNQMAGFLQSAPLGTTFDSLRKQLQSSLTEMNTTLAALPEKKAELQKQLETLTAQQKKLDQEKLLLSYQLSSGAQKIADGLKEVSNGEKEIQSALDKAAANAGISSLLSQTTLKTMLTAQNFSMPAGYLQDGDVKYAVKVGDQFKDADELKTLPLYVTEIDGLGTVTLADVADITETDNTEERFAKVNGSDGILLTLQKQSTSSTSTVSANLQAAIEKLQKDNPGLVLSTMMDQGIYIKMVVSTVLSSLLYGGLLAILILLLFLRDFKPTLVVALSIPISLMLAITLMYFSGVTINIISLAGLALGVGMLVDNSIVVIENTYRLRASGVPAGKAALAGAKQVAGAITASTLTTVCVFLPIVFTNGITKQLFADMGLTIAFSLLASLIVALTVVPALSATLLKNLKTKSVNRPSKIRDAYGKALDFCLKRKWIPLVLVVVLFALSVFGATQMGTAFIPDSTSDQMTMSVSLPEGEKVTSAKLRTKALDVMNAIDKITDVETVGVYENTGGVSMLSSSDSLSLYIVLSEEKTRNAKTTIAELKEKAAKVEGCVTELASNNMMSSYTDTGVQVTIRGNNLDELKALSDQVASVLNKTEGLKKVDDGQGDPTPELRITVDKGKAMACSLTVAQVYQQVAQAIKSSISATTLELTDETIDVTLNKSAEQSYTKATLADYPLTYTDTATGTGKTVRLGDVAVISEATGMSSIGHNNFVRIVTVEASVEDGYNIGLISRDLQKQLDGIAVPDGYEVKIEGENETINNTLRDVFLMVLLAILLIYLIMVAQFQSFSGPFVVMFTIPLAVTGGLLALWIFGFELSVISVLGFLVLSGVVVNNGIVFVDTANQLQRQGMPRREALIETGKMRLRPIFMTAITTILGLTTLALGIGTGADMLQPMAVVVVFGLAYATLLTLFVVPVLCDGIFMRKLRGSVEIEEDAEAPEEFQSLTQAESSAPAVQENEQN